MLSQRRVLSLLFRKHFLASSATKKLNASVSELLHFLKELQADAKALELQARNTVVHSSIILAEKVDH